MVQQSGLQGYIHGGYDQNLSRRWIGQRMKQNKKLISVIVTAYNIEQYLPRCMDSLLAQTYEPMEIILVDDGSDDGTPELCDKYGEKMQMSVSYTRKTAALPMPEMQVWILHRGTLSAMWTGTTGQSRICMKPCSRPVKKTGHRLPYVLTGRWGRERRKSILPEID